MIGRLAIPVIAAVMVAATVTASPDAASATSAVEAERYFKCPTGYRFSAATDAAHCKKPGYYELVALMPCQNKLGVGLFAQTDHVGNKDMCAGTNPVTGEIAVERGCPFGFSKRIRGGTDQCRKWHSGVIVAPNVAVTR